MPKSKRNLSTNYNLLFLGLIGIVALGTMFFFNQGGVTGSAVSDACYDSDSSQDFYTKGYAKYRSKTLEDYCSQDGVRLYQYYCKSSIKISKIHGYICPGGCQDGACLRVNVCGNGIIETGEQCDDGNADEGDGCSKVCVTEGGYQCRTTSVCNYG